MIYLTGVQALNIPCSLDTTGDWHTYGIQWTKLNLKDSNKSIFKDFGIENNKKIPFHVERYNVANHIRAVLDLICDGDFSNAQGLNNDYICNDLYDSIIFSKDLMLRFQSNWKLISKFMEREYKMKWLRFIQGANA